MKTLLNDELLLGEVNKNQGAVHIRERNLFEFAKSVWRWRLLMLTIVVLALLGGVGFTILIPKQYTAQAVLQLNTSNTEFADFNAVVSQQDVDELAVGSEIYVLASYPVALKVIEQLGLINDPEFNLALREPSLPAKLFNEIAAGWIQTDPVEALSTPAAASDPFETGQAAKINVAANLLDNLSVWNEGRSYTIFASFRSEDRVKAAAIVNLFADTYLQRQLDADSQATENVSSWLDERLEEARQHVRVAEARIEAYRTENQLVDVGAEGSLAGQQLGQINRQLAETSIKRSELEARLTHARELIANQNAYSIPEVISSSVVQQVRSEATALDRRRAELAAIYGTNHPEMKAIVAELVRLERKVYAEISNIVEGMAAELNVVINRQAKLSDSLVNLRSAVGNVDKANTKLRELEREAEASRSLFQSLATRRQQAAALQGAQQTYARLVAPAVPPHKPSHPNRIAVVGLSLAGGIGLSLLLIAVFEYRDRDRLRRPAQLESMFGLTCYGMAPEFGSETPKGGFSRLRRGEADSTAIHTGAIRRIRNALYRDLPRKSPLLIMVTSSLPAEGKSTFSTSLAREFAGAGRQTLLVDADIHRPKIEKMLKLDEPMVDDERVRYLRRASDTKGRLDALLLAEAIDKNTEGEDPVAREVPTRIEQMAQSYDVVIMDTPPVVLMDDALLLAHLADSILYLVRWDVTPIEAVQAGISRLRSGEVGSLIGLVLSRTDLARHARLGYKDESYFSKQYDYYYSRA